MARLRTTIDGTADSFIRKMYQQYNNQISSGIRTINTDYANLVEKMADVKVSSLGTPVFDHVTFYLDGFSNNPNAGSDNKKGISKVNILNSTINNAKNIQNSYFQKKRQFEKLINAFSTGTELYSISFDLIFINVTQPLINVRTMVAGEDGTVKETTANDDFYITFNGMLAGSNQFQEDTKKLKQMNALFGMKMPINVSSIYLNNTFGINKIVAENVDYEQDTTYSNITNFTITAYSDFDKKFIIPYKKL